VQDLFVSKMRTGDDYRARGKRNTNDVLQRKTTCSLWLFFSILSQDL